MSSIAKVHPLPRVVLTAISEAVLLGPLVLDDRALLHHEEDALGLPYVLERVAGDGDEVRELAGLERAEAVRDAEQLGDDRGGRPERRGRRHAEPDHVAELLRVAPVREDARVG